MVLDLAILVLHTVNQHVVAISFMDLLPNRCRDMHIRTMIVAAPNRPTGRARPVGLRSEAVADESVAAQMRLLE